jgi:hypothetical protein
MAQRKNSAVTTTNGMIRPCGISGTSNSPSFGGPDFDPIDPVEMLKGISPSASWASHRSPRPRRYEHAFNAAQTANESHQQFYPMNGSAGKLDRTHTLLLHYCLWGDLKNPWQKFELPKGLTSGAEVPRILVALSARLKPCPLKSDFYCRQLSIKK